MRTLVFEAHVGGHFLNHAGLVSAALAEAGAESHVAVATGAPGSFEFESCIAPHRGRVQIHPSIAIDERANPGKKARAKYAALSSLVRELKPDRVYLPTSDGVVQTMALFRLVGLDDVLRSTHVEALLMNGAVGHPELLSQREHWKRRISYRVAKWGCHTLYHLNPFVRDWEMAQGIPEERLIRIMPDPVEVEKISKAAARARLGLPPNGRFVGMVGRLDRRKGAHVLIEAFLSADLGPDDMLLLWGPCADEIAPDVRRLLARDDLRHRVWFRDGVLKDEDFYQAIAAMDLLALPYTTTIGSSSIVIRAAAAGRPVVTTGGGWAERVMKRFPLGWTLAGPDPQQLAAMLPRVLEQSANWVPSEAVRRFVEFSSPQNFVAHWTDGLRAATGLPRASAFRSWQELWDSSS